MVRGKSINRRTSKHRAFALLAALAVSLLLGARGEAQSQVFGAVGGAVTDTQGGGVVDAVVSARNLATNAVASAKADSSGRYLIINLQPGNYELTASVA